MKQHELEERLSRLYGMGGSSSYLVAETVRVNPPELETRITILPGAPANLEGCIAGWISEEA